MKSHLDYVLRNLMEIKNTEDFRKIKKIVKILKKLRVIEKWLKLGIKQDFNYYQKITKIWKFLWNPGKN